MLPADQTFLFINKDNDTMAVDAKWSVHLMNLDIWPRMLTSFMHLLNLVCEEVKMCWGFKDVAPSDMAHPSPIYVFVSADFNNDGYKEQLQQCRTVATTSVSVSFSGGRVSDVMVYYIGIGLATIASKGEPGNWYMGKEAVFAPELLFSESKQ
ncbi:unnamed protein product [Sphagnum jensenii]|uniref:Uncharacterized protein n=1 Tax=Sphagnum jensenii TaxID=128206 RepID=A0ABP1BV58_9BRYO